MTARHPPGLLRGSAWASLPPRSLSGPFRPLHLMPCVSLGIVSWYVGSTFGAHLGVPPSPGQRPRLGGRCLLIPDPAGRATPILFLLLNTVSSGRGEHVCPRGHEAKSAGRPAWSSGTSRNSAGCIHSGLPVVWEWACGMNAGMNECSESLSGGPQGRSWHL